MKIFSKFFILTLVAGLSVMTGKGQEERDYLYKPFQVTVFPPIGTNGIDSRECVNKISLNLLWGVNAGLQGIEFGGIANIERDFVKGAQFAGVANIVRGSVTGLQVSHLVNLVDGDFLGAQITGFGNFNRGEFRGIQYAGFGNFNDGGIYGISGSGFINTAIEVRGLQGAGFINITDQLLGVQAAGFMNISDFVTGLQVSNFMNIGDEVHGAQVAGFMNIAGDIDGAQVGGFINTAETVKGVQVGFINIADNYEAGVPIGFINIVKNGYHDFEISGSEIWDFNFGYRLGVDRLYTQFMVGSRWDRHDKFWGFGLGVGSRFHITRYFKGSVDLLSYQLIDNRHLYANHPNLLEQVRFTLEGRILKDLKWFIGPTFNILVRPFEYPEPAFLEHLDPWTLYENASGVSYLKMWPGISGGIRF